MSRGGGAILFGSSLQGSVNARGSRGRGLDFSRAESSRSFDSLRSCQSSYFSRLLRSLFTQLMPLSFRFVNVTGWFIIKTTTNKKRNGQIPSWQPKCYVRRSLHWSGLWLLYVPRWAGVRRKVQGNVQVDRHFWPAEHPSEHARVIFFISFSFG